MNTEINNSVGLYLDAGTIRKMCAEIKQIGAPHHEDIVVANGDQRVSMTVDEFLDKIGA